MGKTKRINLLKKSSLPHTVAAKPKPENPFDKFANARKKHDILNRKVKGEDRNVGRARAKAIDERKKKLLLDFKQSKRSNQIVDKRFGENDPGMSPEEKMFLRFQRERVKKVRNSSIYNLDEEKTEFLTHRGSILGESNIQDEEWRSDDDEETNGKIHKDVVNKLHFGGGLVPKKTQEQDLPEGSNKPSHFEAMMESLGADNTMKKSRLDALQEIVMKSKFYKMQRKEAKEEQESERKRLDAAFEELFSSHAIEYEDKKPKKKKIDFNDLLSSLRSGKGEDAEEDSGDEEKGNADEDEEADDYDRVMKEMMFEPKVQPSDRMKTAEEIALANKEKLEELEKARLRRMKRSSMDARDLEDLKQTSKRKRNDDELDDIDFGNDRRNKMKQVQMNQNRVDEDDQDSELNDEDEFDSENDIDEEDEDEIDSDEDDEEEEEEEEDDEDLEGDEDDLEDEDDLSDDIDDEDDMEDEDDEDDAEEEEEFPKKRNRRRRGNEGDDNDLPSIEPVVREQFDEMPHKMPCPTDIHAFDDMIHQYCRSSDDRIELVRRIITWNNVHLPGNEGKENKRVIHNFLNILVKYFIRLGDSIPSCKTEEQLQDLWKELNALTGNIFQVTQDLQKNAIPLLSRSLKIIDEQFQKSIRDYQIGQHSSCLLSFGKLLFFQLIAHLFSVTDLENHIVNISILILTQQLTQCPMNNLEEIYLGVITCQILLSSYNSSETKRIMPEVISFLSSTLLCFVPKLYTLFPETAERGKSDSLQSNLYYNRSFYQSYKHYVLNNFKYSQLGHVRQNLASSVKGEDSKKDKRSTGEIMKEVFTNSSIQWKLFTPIDSLDNRVELAEQILLLVYRLIVDYVVPYYSSYNAFPELVHPLQQILQQLAPHQSPVLSHSLQAIHYEALQSIILSIQSVEENRKPLRWREKQLNTVEAKTPKYHINYIIKRDREEYDQENKERSQLKQLTRQLKREQKAAMRELRRDADFIEQERYKEKQVKFEKLRNERFKNFQWLEEQQATINEQVKKGKGLLKGGGSSVAKKPRIRR